MKKCIWCLETEEVKPFKKEAHVVPQSLGGVVLCANVCDDCNHNFGSYHNALPPVEKALKEAFAITRARMLATDGDIGKNKSLSRFTSEYFNLNFKNHSMSVKPKYILNSKFQSDIARQFKRGIYKMYLEGREEYAGDGHDERFDFIRNYSRYDIGELPVFYFNRTVGVMLALREWFKKPSIIFQSELKMKYLVENDHFFEFELMGHIFSIPTTKYFPSFFEDYKRNSFEAKQGFFSTMKVVERFDDIDLSLSLFDK
jgi:hypothetical protein